MNKSTSVERVDELRKFWANLTWTCMVCGQERPDQFISVDSRRLVSPQGVVMPIPDLF